MKVRLEVTMGAYHLSEWTCWNDLWIMVKAQPNKMVLTICNSISHNCFRLMRDWRLENDWDMQPWFTAYIFDIGHPCYGQLTPAKKRYPLTSITWSHLGLKFRTHRGHVIFSEVDCCSVTGFWLDAGSSQVNLWSGALLLGLVKSTLITDEDLN